MVMSLARCMSAISAGDLIMRHPAVTGVALTASNAGRFLAKSVEDGEADLLFDTQRARGDSDIAQGLGGLRRLGGGPYRLAL